MWPQIFDFVVSQFRISHVKPHGAWDLQLRTSRVKPHGAQDFRL